MHFIYKIVTKRLLPLFIKKKPTNNFTKYKTIIILDLAIFLFLLQFICYVFAEQGDVPFLKVTFLDVGQGDAIFIQTHQKTILLDAGDDRLNAGSAVIVPYLKCEGIKKIDYCIITHPHRDHFGGFIDIINNFNVNEIIYSSDVFGGNTPEESPNDALVYMKLYNSIKNQNIPYNKARTGMILNWGSNIKVEVLHAADIEGEPPNFNIQPIILRTSNTNLPELKSNANNKSLIIKATLGKISYLFTGDVEKEGEEKVIERYSNKLTSTILKVAHHGSKSSTTMPFLEIARPKYAIISVGNKNIFGHPNKETLDKLAYYKAKILRTDQDGTIVTYTTGEDIKITTNQSELAFTQVPQIINITPNSATIQWETNKNSNSIVYWGENSYQFEKIIDQYVKKHTVTLVNLNPNTKYIFKVVSYDEKIPNQYVTSEGELITPTGVSQQYPVIISFNAHDKKAYLKSQLPVSIILKNPTPSLFSNAQLKIFQYSISDDNLLISQDIRINPNSQNEVRCNVTLNLEGEIDIIAVLYINANIADTASIKIKVEPKIAIVDCAHGNTDYYKGIFSGMKMDLYNNLGILLKSTNKQITEETLKDAILFISSDPQSKFSPSEIYALSCFVSNGGALMLFMKSDYNNLSNPEYFNEILSAIGSKIRFNDDQFCDPTNNIGPPWRPFIRVFPSTIIQNVDKLLLRSACTLVSNTSGPLLSSNYLHILASGDDDSYNIDCDGQNDCSFYYASSSQNLQIPVIAVENLPAGKVACYGEKLYDHKLYSDNKIPTALFNRQVITWLTQKNQNTNLDQLISSLEELDFIKSLEYQINYLDSITTKLLHETSKNFNNPQYLQKILRKITISSNKYLKKLQKDLMLLQKFKTLHKEP